MDSITQQLGMLNTLTPTYLSGTLLSLLVLYVMTTRSSSALSAHIGALLLACIVFIMTFVVGQQSLTTSAIVTIVVLILAYMMNPHEGYENMEHLETANGITHIGHVEDDHEDACNCESREHGHEHGHEHIKTEHGKAIVMEAHKLHQDNVVDSEHVKAVVKTVAEAEKNNTKLVPKTSEGVKRADVVAQSVKSKLMSEHEGKRTVAKIIAHEIISEHIKNNEPTTTEGKLVVSEAKKLHQEDLLHPEHVKAVVKAVVSAEKQGTPVLAVKSKVSEKHVAEIKKAVDNGHIDKKNGDKMIAKIVVHDLVKTTAHDSVMPHTDVLDHTTIHASANKEHHMIHPDHEMGLAIAHVGHSPNTVQHHADFNKIIDMSHHIDGIHNHENHAANVCSEMSDSQVEDYDLSANSHESF